MPIDRVEPGVGLGPSEPSKVGRLGGVDELIPGRPARAILRRRRRLGPGPGLDELVPGAPGPVRTAGVLLRFLGRGSPVGGAVRANGTRVPPPHRLRRARRGVHRALVGCETVAGGHRDDHVRRSPTRSGGQPPHLSSAAKSVATAAVRTKGLNSILNF